VAYIGWRSRQVEKIEKADLCYSKGFVNLELAGADFTRVISLVFSYISAGAR
jgi:hypothetical protein